MDEDVSAHSASSPESLRAGSPQRKKELSPAREMAFRDSIDLAVEWRWCGGGASRAKELGEEFPNIPTEYLKDRLAKFQQTADEFQHDPILSDTTPIVRVLEKRALLVGLRLCFSSSCLPSARGNSGS
jgi:hypothetical protein